MAKIIAPNKQYTGVSASVPFVNGVGQTDNKNLISWFETHGYSVVEEDANKGHSVNIDDMTVEELVAYAGEKNIDIGKATSQSGIIEKIKALDQVKQGE